MHLKTTVKQTAGALFSAQVSCCLSGVGRERRDVSGAERWPVELGLPHCCDARRLTRKNVSDRLLPSTDQASKTKEQLSGLGAAVSFMETLLAQTRLIFQEGFKGVISKEMVVPIDPLALMLFTNY